MLTKAEQERIAAAVKQAEGRTSGEIVSVIVGRASDYAATRWVFAIIFGLLVTATTVFFHEGWPPLAYLWLEVGVIAAAYAVSVIPFLLRILVPRRTQVDKVHRRALEAFYTQGLSDTRDRTGVLIFVSLLEHRVEILADRGIDTVVPTGTWDDVVEKLITAIRAKDLVGGLCTAIQSCGDLLTEKFPRKADDTNELPDAPVVQ